MRNTRSVTTRRLLTTTFSRMLLSGAPYDALTVMHIAREAGVARSTFYEHFRDKAEILAESLKRPFTPLADCIHALPPYDDLQRALEHFWENRALGRALFHSGNRRFIGRVLAKMIQERLASQRTTDRAKSTVFAVAIAEAQIGTIAAWLMGDLRSSVAAIAMTIGRVSQSPFSAMKPDRR